MGESIPNSESDLELYQTKFDPKTYLGYCYQFAETSGQKDNSRFVTFVLCQLSKTFSTGKFRGQRLIEVGTGPTIHTLISACEYFEEIVVSDYVDSNREEIERWLTAKDGCFDWNAHIQFVCDLEGKRTPAVVSETIRQRVKQVLKCDICLEKPFAPVTVEPADCVVSSLCLEAACKDRDSYRRSLRAMVGLLGPRGVLVLIGDLDETFYTVGEQKFLCVSLSQEFIQETLSELGLTVLEFTLQQAQDRNQNHKCDYEASFHLIARKNV
ncbi:nicotinamide N-methyltransferase-like [Osmerus eperlanus]|uniref:nicotinamide N-methyltransferase-like n=1 Tax=Osmerus eperlanus TaxID=29151 RepID=UPI002E15755E